jgi:cytochrome P450
VTAPLEQSSLPSYLPADTVTVDSYSEFLEVLRSPKMRPEPPGENAPISGGALNTLYGAAHTHRRRAMNRLVRPEALELYREDILLPTLLGRLADLRATASSDGRCRVDLVHFTQRVFIQFAGAIVGLHDVASASGGDELLEVFGPLLLAQKVKFIHGDHRPIVEAGLAAKKRYAKRFFDPAVAACPVAHTGKLDESQSAHDLIALLEARLDPLWGDHDTALKETLVVLVGAIETSATLITHAVDELTRWFDGHHKDRDLIGDLPFLSGVIQETLRLHPSQPVLTRQALEDVVLSTGRAIKKGQWVAGMAMAANCDLEKFGPDATSFNPHRSLPPGIPWYGTTFGSGPHQCLGLRVVLGDAGIGTHTHVLRTYMAAGVARDPDNPPHREASDRDVYDRYPVVFNNLEEALGWPST